MKDTSSYSRLLLNELLAHSVQACFYGAVACSRNDGSTLSQPLALLVKPGLESFPTAVIRSGGLCPAPFSLP